MSYFPFHRLADQDTDCLLVPVEELPECPIERAEQTAIKQFISNNRERLSERTSNTSNPGVPYKVEKTRKYGHVTIVVRGIE